MIRLEVTVLQSCPYKLCGGSKMAEVKRLSHKEFVLLAIDKLKKGEYKAIHTVYSGFNSAFKAYFPNDNPVDVTKQLAKDGIIAIIPTKGGARIMANDGSITSSTDVVLKKMGL